MVSDLLVPVISSCVSELANVGAVVVAEANISVLVLIGLFEYIAVVPLPLLMPSNLIHISRTVLLAFTTAIATNFEVIFCKGSRGGHRAARSGWRHPKAPAR